MVIKFKDNPVGYAQHQLFPSNVFDLLPISHDCFIYHDIFQQIDTCELNQHYSHKGQRAYAPLQITSILIYAYSHGVFSSRQIEKRCNEDLGFMYISGKHCPNFRVLSDFRKDHGAFFRSCFKQTVAFALQLKLASLGHVSLDGSKFKANSSKHKAMSYGYMKEQEAQLCKEIEALIAQAEQSDEKEDQAYQERTGYEVRDDLQHKQKRLKQIQAAKIALEEREVTRHPDEAIADKKQISFADTDACIMGKQGNHFEYSYNGQMSVDGDTQIIVGQHVSQRANDQQEVARALDEVESNCTRPIEKLSLDNGYYSGDNLQTVADKGIDAYIATNRGEKIAKEPLSESERKLVKADFRYDEGGDCFHCPGEQSLMLKRVDKKGRRIYQGETQACKNCVFYHRCCGSKSGEARCITADDKEPLRRAMNEHMHKPKSQEIYARRKVIVEPAFGHIKNLGFRGFSVRGKEKVAGEFSLVCAAYNIKKIVRSTLNGLIRPEFGNGRLMPI